MFKKLIHSIVIFCFFLLSLDCMPKASAESGSNLGGNAETFASLPAPGSMVKLSPAYEPVIIKGVSVHKDNPFLFDFIVDAGQDKMSGDPLKKEGEKLIKYFLAGLAIPDKDVWVNLSPYEKDKIVPETLGHTDMGRDLLGQDYILKQISASLIYPENKLGRTFWDKVYAKAQAMYGTTEIPVNTFNKVWITADKAEVFEHNQKAFVIDSHLKVMLEEDYLALSKNAQVPEGAVSAGPGPRDPGLSMKSHQVNNLTHNVTSQVIRQIILPQLEKEVNTGKNFANLRQIFNSIILSSWYKKNLRQALLNQVYADKNEVKGIDLNDPGIQKKIYEQYLKAYRKGVFNYIKEDALPDGQSIPRKYFSGGVDEGMASDPVTTIDMAMGVQKLSVSAPGRALVDMKVGLEINPFHADAAMLEERFFIERQHPLGVDYLPREEMPEGSPQKAALEKILQAPLVVKKFRGWGIPEDQGKTVTLEWMLGHLLSVDRKFLKKAFVMNGVYHEGEGVSVEIGLVKRDSKANSIADDIEPALIFGKLSDLIEKLRSRLEEALYGAYNISVRTRDVQTGEFGLGSKKQLVIDFKPKVKELIPSEIMNRLTWITSAYHLKLKDTWEYMSIKEKLTRKSDKDILFLGSMMLIVTDIAFKLTKYDLENAKRIVKGKTLSKKDRIVLSNILAGYMNKFQPLYSARYHDTIVKQTHLLLKHPRSHTIKYQDELTALAEKEKTKGFLDDGEIKRTIEIIAESRKSDLAMESVDRTPGGIDLNISDGMRVRKEGDGVKLIVDPAMIERIKKDGIDSLSPIIYKMIPITSIWSLLEIQAPIQ